MLYTKTVDLKLYCGEIRHYENAATILDKENKLFIVELLNGDRFFCNLEDLIYVDERTDLPDMEAQVIELGHHQNNKIAAIKHYRTVTGCDLLEAKQSVERILNHYRGVP